MKIWNLEKPFGNIEIKTIDEGLKITLEDSSSVVRYEYCRYFPKDGVYAITVDGNIEKKIKEKIEFDAIIHLTINKKIYDEIKEEERRRKKKKE